ncbi:MAG: DMT family transporter [Flavobacteriales bacterium]|nr:DMT family transporter [Flavobacteriales bacterium]
MNRKSVSHILIFTANLIYALTYIFAKDVMPGYVHYGGFILLRATGAVFLFWLTYLIFVREKVDRKDILRIAIAGVFGVALNQLLFFKGLEMSTPIINASIIMTSNPIMVLIMSYFILKERITIRKGIGILLGLIGALNLIFHGGGFSTNSEYMLGNVYILINAASYGVFLVIISPLMKKYNPVTVMTFVFSFGLLYVLPFGFSELQNLDWHSLPLTIIYEVLFVVIGTTYLAYLFNTSALKNLNPSVVSMYIYTQPVLATLFAYLLSKDELSQNKIISAIIIFIGVYLVSVRSKKQKTNKLS